MVERKPEDMPERFQLYIGELGPPLAAAAAANGRTVTQEILHRLKESLERDASPYATEGTAAHEAALSAPKYVVLAFNLRQAKEWAVANMVPRQDFIYANNPESLRGIRGRIVVRLEGCSLHPKSSAIFSMVHELVARGYLTHATPSALDKAAAEIDAEYRGTGGGVGNHQH